MALIAIDNLKGLFHPDEMTFMDFGCHQYHQPMTYFLLLSTHSPQTTRDCRIHFCYNVMKVASIGFIIALTSFWQGAVVCKQD